MKTAEELRGEVSRLRYEYRYRRSGLIVSTFVITIFAGLLYWRIRIEDRAGGYRPPPRAK